jgi:hypothetical protein
MEIISTGAALAAEASAKARTKEHPKRNIDKVSAMLRLVSGLVTRQSNVRREAPVIISSKAYRLRIVAAPQRFNSVLNL